MAETITQHPASQQPVPTTLVQTTALAPSPTTAPTSPAAPSPTIAPTATALPIKTPVPTAEATGAMVRGTINYPTDPTLPQDAVLTVKLMPGTPGFLYPDMVEPLGEARINPAASGRVPFAIEYDPGAINPMLPYTIFAEINTNSTRYLTGGARVITNNEPSEVDIQLHPRPTATAVTGTVDYPNDRELPPDALLTIRLQTPVDGVGGPHVLGQQRVSPVGSAPIQFTIPVDPTALNPTAVYSVFAFLDAPGRLTWLAEEQPVLTWGQPTTVDLTLQPPTNSMLLSGLVTVPEGSTLPRDTVVSVQIANIYNGTIGSTLREHTITPIGTSPIPYAIEYTEALFQPSESYALYASARLHERLLFTSPLVPLNSAALPSTRDLHVEQPANISTVRGIVRYDSDDTLPPDAKLLVQLADTRSVGGDGAPLVIATQTITPSSGEAMNFAIEYDPLAIDGRSSYAIFVEIRVGENVLVRSLGQDVITNGNPTKIEVRLQPSR